MMELLYDYSEIPRLLTETQLRHCKARYTDVLRRNCYLELINTVAVGSFEN